MTKDEHGPIVSKVFDTVDVDRPVTFEVVCQQDVWGPAGQLDHGYARPHTFDRETQPPPEHFGEVASVRRDILARCVQVVELLKRGH